MNDLAQINAYTRDLSAARSVPKVLDLRDKAQLLVDHLKQQKAPPEVLVNASALKVRSERRLGELLPEVVQHGGDRRSSFHDESLKGLPEGVTMADSSRWQAIARIPADVFEQHLQEFIDKGREATTAHFLRLARLYAPSNGGPAEVEDGGDRWRIIEGDCRAHLGIT